MVGDIIDRTGAFLDYNIKDILRILKVFMVSMLFLGTNEVSGGNTERIVEALWGSWLEGAKMKLS